MKYLLAVAVLLLSSCALKYDVTISLPADSWLMLFVDGEWTLIAQPDYRKDYTIPVAAGWHVFHGDIEYAGLPKFYFKEEVLVADDMEWAPYLLEARSY